MKRFLGITATALLSISSMAGTFYAELKNKESSYLQIDKEINGNKIQYYVVEGLFRNNYYNDGVAYFIPNKLQSFNLMNSSNKVDLQLEYFITKNNNQECSLLSYKDMIKQRTDETLSELIYKNIVDNKTVVMPEQVFTFQIRIDDFNKIDKKEANFWLYLIPNGANSDNIPSMSYYFNYKFLKSEIDEIAKNVTDSEVVNRCSNELTYKTPMVDTYLNNISKIIKDNKIDISFEYSKVSKYTSISDLNQTLTDLKYSIDNVDINDTMKKNLNYYVDRIDSAIISAINKKRDTENLCLYINGDVLKDEAYKNKQIEDKSCIDNYLSDRDSKNITIDDSTNTVANIEQTVLNNNNGKYAITGYFAPYTFGNDSKSNWTFTFANGAGTYQLLGDTENGIGIFGWVKRDVTPNDPAYYMVQYEPTPFGWLVFNIDENGNCKNVYKLAGQDPVTKSFSYDIDGDGTTDVLSDLECKVAANTVEFYSPTLQTPYPTVDTTDSLMPPSIPSIN